MTTKPQLLLLLAINLFCALATLADNANLSLGENSYTPSGYISYVVRGPDGTTLHFAKITHAKSEGIFSTPVPTGSHAPILLQDAVIVVTVEGRILKFDYSGKMIFDSVLTNFSGASKFSGKLTSKLIFIQNTFSKKQAAGLQHQVWLVDISMDKPSVHLTRPTGSVVRTFISSDSLYVFTLEDVERIRF
jgi:hypothetical protein